MAGLSSTAGWGTVPPEEIRFGVVLNGGVSLAVWMGGSVLELDRLVKSAHDPTVCPAYALMLRLAGASARVDVVAGTSAGGINGSALALAQVNRRANVSILRDVWIDQGQLETLLRQPFRGSPSSLMKGDAYFLPELNSALARLASPADLRDRTEAPVDLTIATTVLNGNQLITTDGLGQQLPQALHAAKFHWRRWPTPPPTLRPGEPEDPFDLAHIRDTAAQLALASRASASFPIAFEPTFVPVGSDGSGRTGEDLLLRPDMATVVESWGMTSRRDRSRFAVDGGLLANTPTKYALQAIEAMPASGPVRRVMLLVYPHAPAPGLDPADQFSAAPTLLTTLNGLLGALSAQGGRTFVEELEGHNRQAAGRRGTRSDILGTLGGADQTLESLALGLFPHYRRLRKWRAARDLAQRKVDQFATLPVGAGPAATDWGYERVRTAAERAQDWLDDRSRREQPTTAGTPSANRMEVGLPYVPRQLPTDAEPDVGPGWGWGVTGAGRVAEAGADLLRRLVWVLPPGPEYDAVSSARRTVSDLAARIEACRERTDAVWDTQEVLVSLEPSQSYWAFRLGCYRALMAGGGTDGLEQLATQIAENEAQACEAATRDARRGNDRRTAVLTALTHQLGAVSEHPGSAGVEVRGLVEQVVTALLPALAVLRDLDLSMPKGFADARLDAWQAVLGDRGLTAEQLLTRLLQLEVANSALGDEVATGSTIPVEVVQLSAQTENAFTRYTRTADDKLGGMSVNRFGGFLKRSWRLNDWIWGRLDAATILCRTVLHPARVRRSALLSGYVGLEVTREQAETLAKETLAEIVQELFGPEGIPGDASLQELGTTAVRELADCFDVPGVAPGDLPTSMPALAHLFALAVHLRVLPDDLSALQKAIDADRLDGANERSRGQFFASENARLIDRVRQAGANADPEDRQRLLFAFDRAGIGREPLQAETSSDLMLRSGTTAAAVGATVLDSPRSGLGALRPLTRGLRGAMLIVFWGMTALTGKGAIARSLALLGLAMGAVLVTLAAFGAVPAGLAGLAAGIGVSLLLLAFAYGALRSGTMLHGLVLLTPLVPVLAEAVQRAQDKGGNDARSTVTLGAIVVLALGLMALGTLPAATGSVWTGLDRLADRMGVPPAGTGGGTTHRVARGVIRGLRGLLRLLAALGWRLLFLLAPLALAVWVVGSGWSTVVTWLDDHFALVVALAVVAVVVGVLSAAYFGGRLQVLAEDRSGEKMLWSWRRVAHPAGVSASWAVVYGTGYLVLALVLVRDPWDWRADAWAQALCLTALLLGALLTLVVPVAVPLRALAGVVVAEQDRAHTVPEFLATPGDFAGHDVGEITADQSYVVDLIQRDAAYRRWVAYQPGKGVAVPRLTRSGQRIRRLVRPDGSRSSGLS
ncbi:MAG TPA: patatin-like protein [Nocardioides sp.]|uniref:patatin-like protein n=1 Tax=Nocardioides sp. TaxID=35761 RepID=UPI002C593C95|nr:patatin-like protein [Nocardioides sp.]HQR27611.1 patatin-like protein [Nocardioides sp.]